MNKSGTKQTRAGRAELFTLVSAAAFIPLLMIWQVFIRNDHTADNRVFEVIAPYINDARTTWMKKISFLANHRFLVPANLCLIVILLIAKKRKTALTVLFTALSSLGIMSLLKNLFQRHRPADALVEGITNYSFPSGHAFMGMAFYGLLIWLVLQYIPRKAVRISVILFLSFLLLSIGFSRIYLKVHYTTDVIAGFGLGFGWLYGCIFLAKKTWGKDEPLRVCTKTS